MNFLLIKNKKRKFNFSNNIKTTNIKIGLLLDDTIQSLIPISNPGESFLPSYKKGVNCRRNANGYSYPDKSKEKELRTIYSFSFYPYGNTNANIVDVDIDRLCYPRVEIEPSSIEMMIVQKDDEHKYLIADLEENPNESRILRAINIFVEMFGYCFIFGSDLEFLPVISRTRCNWEILPPGKLPSEYVKEQLSINPADRTLNSKLGEYYIDRLTTIERYHPKSSVEGKNGFMGYYAYIFDRICIFENPIYGNATYVVPSEKWEQLSQLSKGELLATGETLYKIAHTTGWHDKLKEVLVNCGIMGR